MPNARAPHAPPHCPNPECPSHTAPVGCWYVKAGFHERQQAAPHPALPLPQLSSSLQDQTFDPTYWLKRADLLAAVFHGLLACSGFRQMARSHDVSPNTIATHTARLGRHCQLFHERMRPKGPVTEALVLDSFQSFEHSQYTPTLSTPSSARTRTSCTGSRTELRRSGRMTRQKRCRAKPRPSTAPRPTFH
jgi:hypothetical protein